MLFTTLNEKVNQGHKYPSVSALIFVADTGSVIICKKNFWKDKVMTNL